MDLYCMDFYYFSHFIQVWILPPGSNLVLMLLGFCLLLKFYRVGFAFIALSFVILWLLSTPVIAQWLIDGLQYRYPPLQMSQIVQNTKHSAIIVLGGGHEISPDYKNGYILSDATEGRLHYAAYLYHKTHFPIVVSGGALNKSQPTEAQLMGTEMQEYFRVPVAWLEDKSIDTKDEGNLMVSILQKHKINTAYLVTNAFHMSRAMYTFGQSFKNSPILIIAAPMGYAVLQPDQGMLNYLPSLEGLNKSATAMHEYIGLLAYHLSNLL